MRISKFEVSHPDDIRNVFKILWTEKMLAEKILIAQVLFTRNWWRGAVAGKVQTRSFAKQDAEWEDGWWTWTPGQWSQPMKHARAYSNSFPWPPNWVHEGYGLRWYLRLIEKSANTHPCLFGADKKTPTEKRVWHLEKKKHVDLGIICSFALIFCFILKSQIDIFWARAYPG